MGIDRKQRLYWLVDSGVFILIFGSMELVLNSSNLLLRTDDFFVLPERIWFENNADWLMHLLSFNQTRFTGVGDYMAFRPGLFFLNWLLDIFLRHDRELIQFVSILISSLGAFVLYRLCLLLGSRFYGILFALFFAFPRYEATLFTWAHVNPYVIGLAGYALGTLFVHRWWLNWDESVKWKDRNAILASLFFFFASLFHEFVVATLVCIIGFFVWLSWFRPAGKREGIPVSYFRQTSLILGVVVLVYVLLQQWNSLSHNMGSKFFSPGEMSGENSLSIYLLKNRSWQFLKQFWHFFAPVVLLGIISFWGSRNRVRSQGKNSYALQLSAPIIFFLFAFAVIFSGYFLLRVLMRGGTSIWFYSMMGYFLLPLLVIPLVWLESTLGKKKQALLRSSVAIIFLFWVSMATRGLYRLNVGNYPFHQVSNGIIERSAGFFDANPDYCYSGIFRRSESITTEEKFKNIEIDWRTGGVDERFLKFFSPGELLEARTIAITLQYYSCSIKGGEPVYLSVLADRKNIHLDFLSRPKSPKSPGHAAQPAGFSIREEVLALSDRFLSLPFNQVPRSPMANIWEDVKEISKTREITRGQFSSSIVSFATLSLRFATQELFPIMYNTGLMVGLDAEAKRSTLIQLDNNNVGIYDVNGEGVRCIGAGLLSEMRGEGILSIRRHGLRCLVFVDDHLVADYFPCRTRGRVGWVSWDNGTPPETVFQMTYQPGTETAHWADQLNLISMQKFMVPSYFNNE